MIFVQLFWIFFKIGLFTVGGGYAMIPLIQKELVAEGLMDASQVYDLVGISQITPGPFALNAATFCGMRVGIEMGGLSMGVLGAICATFGVLLPSLIITSVVAIFFFKLSKTKFMKRLFAGMKPATIGLIASTVVTMILAVCFKVETSNQAIYLSNFNNIKLDIVAVLIAVLSALCIIKLKFHPSVVIILGGLLGLFYYSFI